MFNEKNDWGKGAIAQSEFSPDGERMGVVTTLGVYIYGAEELKQLDFIPAGSAWPAAAFSPDWSRLALGKDSTITLLRLSDQAEVAHLETQQGRVTRLLFSPDGSLLGSLVQPPGEEVYTQILELWRVWDGKILGSWTAGALPDVAFTPDSGTLYAWNPVRMDGVHRWQIPSGTPLPVLQDLHPGALAFSPDGNLMAVAEITALNGEILLQSTADGRQTRKLTGGHLGSGGQLRFSPDSSLLLAFGYDGLVQIWHVSDGILLRSFGASPGRGRFLAVSPDNQTLALPAVDGLVFYSLADGRVLRRLEGHFNPVIQAAISPGGDAVAALIGSQNPEDSSLAAWPLPEGQRLYVLPEVGALRFAWSPDGQRLALAAWDGEIRILNSVDGAMIQTLMGHSEQVQSVAWSPDGAEIASSSMQSVKIWQARDGTLLQQISAPGGWVTSLKFSPDGKWLAGLSGDEKIVVWQTSGGRRVAELPASALGDSDVIEFAPGSSFLAVAEQSQLSLWHLTDDKPFRQFPISGAQAITLRISPDGSILACGLTDGTVQLWRMPEGERLQTLKSGFDGIASLDFSSDGKMLLSASGDGTIRLWETHRPSPEVYPSPVPPRTPSAWPGLSNCPNPAGLEPNAALEHQTAVDIIDVLKTGDASARKAVTDPVIWDWIPNMESPGKPIPPEWISQPAPAKDSDYGHGLGVFCGQEVLEASWWVRNCQAPCDKARSSSLIDDLYFFKRNGVWLLWYIY